MIEEKIKQKINNLNLYLVWLKIELNSNYGNPGNIIYEKIQKSRKQIELLQLQLLRIQKINKINNYD